MADEVKVAPSPEKNLPVLRIDLRQKETAGIMGLKPGDPISVEVLGKLRSVELREPFMESKDDFVGYIEVDCQEVSAGKPTAEDTSKNEFSEMAD